MDPLISGYVLFRKPWLVTALLMLLALLLYLPVCRAEYLYTDEAVQLWHYRPGSAYHMFIEQGRYLTDRLVSFLFSHTDSISGLRYVRLFSLLAWMACVPVWYMVLRYICHREQIHPSAPFLVTAWLVCSPACTISIAWASCVELSFAYTAGLLAGYCFYRYQCDRHTGGITALLLSFSVLAGLVSLFSYQNGIGCFFLPFVIRVLGGRAPMAKNFSVLLFAGFIALLYFLLFRWQLHYFGISAGNRTSIVSNPLKKLAFFFARPFVAAWLPGVGYNESDRRVFLYVIPVILLVFYLSCRYILPGQSLRKKTASMLLLLLFCLASYYPSLLVKENYASVRTTLALSLVTLTWLIVLLSRSVAKKPVLHFAGMLLLVLLFAGNGLYNFHIRFLRPHVAEHLEAVASFRQGYDAGTNSFSWQRPAESDFEIRYGITRSWDEFGVPSLFFPWVPEFYFKQLLYEQTGDREKASSLHVTTTPPLQP
ncbi:MAG: hypothetical protein EOO09_03710 [Chitinophagaceae bacterium]|nr:MAG: hypothetical protein EOO09_03710 [Chitinophagaceae bacterium]